MATDLRRTKIMSAVICYKTENTNINYRYRTQDKWQEFQLGGALHVTEKKFVNIFYFWQKLIKHYCASS